MCTLVVNSNSVIKLIIDHNFCLLTVTCFKVLSMNLEIIKLLLIISIVQVVLVKTEINEKVIARASNTLGDDLYKVLAKNAGNIAFSPFSVYSALALLALGSEGATQKELFAKLSVSNMNALKTQYEALFKQVLARNQNILHIANALFFAAPLSEKYKSQADKFFKAKPYQVDFANSESAASTINKWIADQTNQTIKTAVHKDSLGSLTVLMVLNAIYFKAKWEVQFSKFNTVVDAIFHSPSGNVKCNMMVMPPRVQELFSNTNFFMLALPFHGTNIKIAFVKHLRHTTLKIVEETLNHEAFFNAVEHLQHKLVLINIPVFTLDVSYELTEQLRSIGISNIFGNPNFSNMFKQGNGASVDEVIQKTVIEISETGVKAASATSIKQRVRSAPVFQRFILDGPFLFFLYDPQSEVILMRGRVDNPVK